jgi:hypothetical protein
MPTKLTKRMNKKKVALNEAKDTALEAMKVMKVGKADRKAKMKVLKNLADSPMEKNLALQKMSCIEMFKVKEGPIQDSRFKKQYGLLTLSEVLGIKGIIIPKARLGRTAAAQKQEKKFSPEKENHQIRQNNNQTDPKSNQIGPKNDETDPKNYQSSLKNDQINPKSNQIALKNDPQNKKAPISTKYRPTKTVIRCCCCLPPITYHIVDDKNHIQYM